MDYNKAVNGVIFSVFLGNIVNCNSDAIVNAAHEALMGGGGVDGAIHRAAGPRLLQACRNISQKEPGVRCRVGEAEITEAFNLPSKYVIHTVAPKFVGSVVSKGLNDLGNWSLTKNIYKNAKEGTDEDLANCYINSLKLAADYNLTSIVFPSLGTGGHAYPIELACPIAIKSCVNGVKIHNIKKGFAVGFCCFSETDYLVYEEEIKNLT